MKKLRKGKKLLLILGIAVLAILAVVIINNRLIVNKKEEVDTTISTITENISTTKNNITITPGISESSTKTITKTTTDLKNISTASDVMALDGISELVGAISTEDDIVGRFMYCCTNNTYYLLSNDNIVDSFVTTNGDDFILVEDIIIYYTDDTIYYWPILDSSTHHISEIIGQTTWPLSEELVDEFLYQYHLTN